MILHKYELRKLAITVLLSILSIGFFNEILNQHKIAFKLSGHLTCFENFASSAYFGWNLDKLTTFLTGKPNFSGPSNNHFFHILKSNQVYIKVHTQLP